MGTRRLQWQLYPSYLVITVLCLLAASWYASRAFNDFYIKSVSRDLETRVRLLSRQLTGAHPASSREGLQSRCRELGKRISTRITVILPSGKVIADSLKNPERMDNHADRPEVIAALGRGKGTSIRYSHTIGTDMMYVAVPVRREGRTIALLRASMPLDAINTALTSIRDKIILGCFAAALLSAVLCWLVSRRVSGPLEQLTRGAERFARGDMTHRLRLSSKACTEAVILAEAMNRMAAELDERLHTLSEQRNELSTVLAGMSEGVLAVDQEKRIVTINDSAAALFSVDRNQARGRSLEEVVRNTALRDLVNEVLPTGIPVEREVVLRRETEIFLQAHGAPLMSVSKGGGGGAVVVVNDVSRLRRMETVRRDFVANVSHELKTPITAIKGFVETLMGDAPPEREDAERFLSIIASHADRLDTIIEDLLTLSRLELKPEGAAVEFGRVRVADLVLAAQEACIVSAEAKGIRMETSGPEGLSVRAAARLLEQALVNLLDNAVKYGEPGTAVRVRTEDNGDEVVIRVTDEGGGIPPEHLARIFERFYRVDKARSRSLGGSGLGLAIVKHVVQLHGGEVRVKSEVGRGSTFSVHLPKG
jgi:two-component system phosphate regulon sensor histidine kinase PhoR